MKQEQVCEAPAVAVGTDGGTLVARVDGDASACPHCGGRQGVLGTDEEGYQVWRPCPRVRTERRARLFNAAKLGSRFGDSTFASFRPGNDGQGVALRTVRDFALMYPGVSRGLLLWGPVGTGKTHLMVALFRELALRKGVSCRFVDFGHLLSDLRRSFRNEVGGDLVGPLFDAEVLLIDELGKGRATEWELTVLDDLVSRRYNDRKITLATTNFPPREAAPRGAPVNPAYAARAAQDKQVHPETLLDRTNERIYSRLCEMCEFVEVPGVDHRRRRQTRMG